MNFFTSLFRTKPHVDHLATIPEETEAELADSLATSYDATIPVVDMNEFLNPDTRAKFISEMTLAMREVGFFAVVNTGVDIEALDNAYAATEAFYRLPLEEKMKLHTPDTNGQRGYVPGESAKGEAVGDAKEFLHFGRELTDEQFERLGYYQNVWPDSVDLQGPMTALLKALEVHMIPIQEAMSEAIGEGKDFIKEMTDEGDILLRSLHYPGSPPVGTEWAAAHTDIDLFTILPRSTKRGLQVLNNSGEWIDVIVPENSFVINVGDMLTNMTNGEFKSAVHRVVDSGDGEERFSKVLFVHPRSEDSVSPLPQCIARTGGVQKYANATRWELLEERLVDLGLASPEMLEDLAASGLMERLIEVGRASTDAMTKLRDAGLASEAVLKELDRIESAKSMPRACGCRKEEAVRPGGVSTSSTPPTITVE